MSRSRPELLPNEARTLVALLTLHRRGIIEFHGYRLANQLRDQPAEDRTMAYSTLYRCLTRLEVKGLVRVRPDEVPSSGGPPRRLFSLTGAGLERASDLDPSLNPFPVWHGDHYE